MECTCMAGGSLTAAAEHFRALLLGVCTVCMETTASLRL